MTPVAAVAAAVLSGPITPLLLDELDPSPLNPRKTLDQVKVAELAESIGHHGILVPLLIREVPLEGDIVAYHIIAGSRRAAAARLAGELSAPCIVRQMTDDEARELAIVDNLQREDMPALEEADAYEALRQQLGDAERIAARVGKPVEYVAKRLRLVSLGAFSRQALAERLITVDHALLLARLGREDEDAALKWTLDRAAGSTVKLDKIIADCIERRDKSPSNRYIGYSEPETVLKLKAHIEQSSGRKLVKAPWDLEDVSLVPAVGACTVCPQNTAMNTSLFGDLAIEEATCADGICFDSKRAAYVQIQLTAAATHLKLSWKASTVKPKWYADGSGPDRSKVLRAGQWIEAKKGSCPQIVEGVAVDWLERDWRNKRELNPGEVLTACIAEGCKVHPKAYEAKAEPSGPGNQNGSATAKAREKKPLMIAENKLRITFVSKALEGITAIPAEALRFLLIQRLPDEHYSEEDAKVLNALLPGIYSVAKTGKIDSAAFAQAIALASLDDEQLQVDNDGWGNPTDHRADLIKAVRILGYAGPDPWTEAKPKSAKKAAPPALKKAAPKKAVKKAAKKAIKKGGSK